MVIQMIKVSIGKSCQSWGQCVFDAPDVFSLEESERKVWSYLVEDSFEDQLLIAKSHCPNNAINLKKVKNE
jgi:ferredoxin